MLNNKEIDDKRIEKSKIKNFDFWENYDTYGEDDKMGWFLDGEVEVEVKDGVYLNTVWKDGVCYVKKNNGELMRWYK